jgi:hypothetical protein
MFHDIFHRSRSLQVVQLAREIAGIYRQRRAEEAAALAAQRAKLGETAARLAEGQAVTGAGQVRGL